MYDVFYIYLILRQKSSQRRTHNARNGGKCIGYAH